MPAERQYAVLGPLTSDAGNRAILGCEVHDGIPQADRPVVVIWLPDGLAHDLRSIQQIQRDTAIVTRLRHPNIVRVYGLESFEEGWARIVAFVDGEPLAAVLRRLSRRGQSLPSTHVARLMLDYCEGVQHAHEGLTTGPIFHGGIRPETLYVSFQGMGMVAGYGAQFMGAEHTSAGQTDLVSFWAPEQVVGGQSMRSVVTDVYALGATLFLLLTGQQPFEGSSELEQAIMSQELQVPGMHGISGKLLDVARRAMAKRGPDRFESVRVMRDAIAWVMEEETMASHDDISDLMNALVPQDGPDRQGTSRFLGEAQDADSVTLLSRHIEAPEGVDPRLYEASRSRFVTDPGKEMDLLLEEALRREQAIVKYAGDRVLEARPYSELDPAKSAPQAAQAGREPVTVVEEPLSPRTAPDRARTQPSSASLTKQGAAVGPGGALPPAALSSQMGPASGAQSSSPPAPQAAGTSQDMIALSSTAPSSPVLPASGAQAASNSPVPQATGTSQDMIALPSTASSSPVRPASGAQAPSNMPAPQATGSSQDMIALPSTAPSSQVLPSSSAPVPPAAAQGVPDGSSTDMIALPATGQGAPLPSSSAPAPVVPARPAPQAPAPQPVVPQGQRPQAKQGHTPAPQSPPPTRAAPMAAKSQFANKPVQGLGGTGPSPVPKAPMNEVSAITNFGRHEGDSSRSLLVLLVLAALVLIGIVLWGKKPPEGLSEPSGEVPKDVLRAVLTQKEKEAATAVDSARSDSGGAEQPAPDEAGADPATPVKTVHYGTLVLKTEPNVDVYDRCDSKIRKCPSDSVLLGRTPLKMKLSAGKHRLRFTDKKTSLNAYRTYTIKPDKERRDHVIFGKSELTVLAPKGARIILNQKLLGKAPLKGVTVYEGRYRLKVTHQGLKWQEIVEIPPGQKVEYDVRIREDE